MKIMMRCVQIGLVLLLAVAAPIVTAAVTIVAVIPSAVMATVLFIYWRKGGQRIRTDA